MAPLREKRETVLVVIPQLGYEDGISSGPVDESVLVIDSSRPVAGEPVFERLGFARTGERIAHYLANETVDAL